MNIDLVKGKCFVDYVKENYPKDRFFNLKRNEDLSTIYHGEFKGGFECNLNYWAEPPIMFRTNCELLIAVIGNTDAMAIAADKVDGVYQYKIVRKHPGKLSDKLAEAGFEIDTPYSNDEIVYAISLVN